MTCVAEASRPPSKCVLLVEDDFDIRDQLRELFEDEGYSVAEACNGAEALVALSGGLKPEMVLLDLTMPVMDGWAFLDAIRERPAYHHLPIVVASAVADANELPRHVSVLRKPFSIEALLDTVSRRLH